MFRRYLPALLLGSVLASCRQEIVGPTPPPTANLPEHITLGNPSGATPDPTQPSNYLLAKAQYYASYHRDQGKPNWVSWHLSSE